MRHNVRKVLERWLDPYAVVRQSDPRTKGELLNVLKEKGEYFPDSFDKEMLPDRWDNEWMYFENASRSEGSDYQFQLWQMCYLNLLTDEEFEVVDAFLSDDCHYYEECHTFKVHDNPEVCYCCDYDYYFLDAAAYLKVHSASLADFKMCISLFSTNTRSMSSPCFRHISTILTAVKAGFCRMYSDREGSIISLLGQNKVTKSDFKRILSLKNKFESRARLQENTRRQWISERFDGKMSVDELIEMLNATDKSYWTLNKEELDTLEAVRESFKKISKFRILDGTFPCFSLDESEIDSFAEYLASALEAKTLKRLLDDGISKNKISESIWRMYYRSNTSEPTTSFAMRVRRTRRLSAGCDASGARESLLQISYFKGSFDMRWDMLPEKAYTQSELNLLENLPEEVFSSMARSYHGEGQLTLEELEFLYRIKDSEIFSDALKHLRYGWFRLTDNVRTIAEIIRVRSLEDRPEMQALAEMGIVFDKLQTIDFRAETKCNNYTARVLEANDVLAFDLGHLTSCCQHFRGAGETAMWYGIIDPRAGFWVVRKNGSVKAQAEIWEDHSTGYLVFDNIEFAHCDEGHRTNVTREVWPVLKAWLEACPYDNVIMGCGYNDMAGGNLPTSPKPSAPRNSVIEEYCQQPVYTDTKERCVYLKQDGKVCEY